MTNHIITVDGKPYDLTQNTTPLGLLPKKVVEAIQNWPHGLERCRYSNEGPSWEDYGYFPYYFNTVFRCKPAPQVTRQELFWLEEGSVAYDMQADEFTHKITIEYPGDTLPDGDYLGPEGVRFIVECLK